MLGNHTPCPIYFCFLPAVYLSPDAGGKHTVSVPGPPFPQVGSESFRWKSQPLCFPVAMENSGPKSQEQEERGLWQDEARFAFASVGPRLTCSQFCRGIKSVSSSVTARPPDVPRLSPASSSLDYRASGSAPKRPLSFGPPVAARVSGDVSISVGVDRNLDVFNKHRKPCHAQTSGEQRGLRLGLKYSSVISGRRETKEVKPRGGRMGGSAMICRPQRAQAE